MRREHLVDVKVLDTPFRVEFADESSATRFADAWSRCLALPDSEATSWSVGEMGDGQSSVLEHVLATQLTTRAIEDLAGSRLMLHAVGLASPAGRVAALIGPPGSGKTTAAVTLARTGLGYVTDETVAIAPDGSVLPFPRPLALADGGAAAPGKVQWGPDELGLAPGADDLEIARLVLLNRVLARRGRPSLEKVSLIDGMLEVIPHTSALTSLDRPLGALAHLIDACGGVYRLSYTEISDVDSLLDGLLESSAPQEPVWTTADGLPPTGSARWALMDGHVRQVPLTDALIVGDEALLLVDRTPVRLSGIGLTVWTEARSAPTTAEMVERVVASHGPHPEAWQLVCDAVTVLCDAGVLGWRAPEPMDRHRRTAQGQPTPLGGASCCGPKEHEHEPDGP